MDLLKDHPASVRLEGVLSELDNDRSVRQTRSSLGCLSVRVFCIPAMGTQYRITEEPSSRSSKTPSSRFVPNIVVSRPTLDTWGGRRFCLDGYGHWSLCQICHQHWCSVFLDTPLRNTRLCEACIGILRRSLSNTIKPKLGEVKPNSELKPALVRTSDVWDLSP